MGLRLDPETTAKVLAAAGAKAGPAPRLPGPKARGRVRRAKPGVSEAAFQKLVIDYARLAGWRCASFRKVRVQRKSGSVYFETPVAADGKGWPDLALTRAGRFIVAELKVPPNKPTKEQLEWLAAFRQAGIPAFVWFPKDWEQIEKVLGK